MPLHRSLCAIYALFSSPIWQSAMAAPAMSPFTTHASSFHPYVDPPGYVLHTGQGGYERYSQDHLHGASLTGLTFLRDTKLRPEEKTFTALFHDWHFQTVQAPKPLGIGNELYWAQLSENHMKILNGLSLKEWFEKKKIPKPANFEKSASDFEYMLKRAQSGQEVWWRSEELVHWQKNGYDWMSMTKMGDVLEFDKPGLQWMDPTQKGRQLKEVIKKGNWHTSVGYHKRDPTGCLEFQALDMFKDHYEKPMMNRMIKMFPEDVRRKLHDAYIAGSELPDLGPGKLVSPDAPAPAPEPGASDYLHHIVVQYPSPSADSSQHKKWLDTWLSFFGNHP